MYYEVFIEPTVSTNPEHLKAINTRKFKNYIRKPSEKTQLTIWIAAIIVLGLGILIGGIFLVETFKWNLLIPIAVYIILYIIISRITQNSENKATGTLKFIIDIPFAIIYLAMKCTLPAFSMIAGFFFIALFAAGIPLIMMFSADFILQINFTHTTYVFVIVSVGTILCVYRSEFMHGLLSKYTPLRP